MHSSIIDPVTGAAVEPVRSKWESGTDDYVNGNQLIQKGMPGFNLGGGDVTDVTLRILNTNNA